MSIQSILFNKLYYTKREAINWINNHNFYPIKFHETDNFYRFRMLAPKKGARYRVKKITKGIEFIFVY
jgi:hypothetical protein